MLEQTLHRDTNDRTRILDLASEEFGIRLDEMGFDPRRMERLAEIGLMTAGIIHDVGNLMQIINAGARLAASKLESGAKTEAVDALAGILQTANRASALSRTLVYRASATRVVAQATDLSSALAGMERALTWAAGPSVQLEIAVLSSKLSIACDIDSLEDALVNLTLNARDAMPNGGKVSVLAQLIQLNGHSMAEIRVSDTGLGMTAEIAATAFEPFFSSRHDGSGTGLGLASVAAFVRELGGHALVESEPGQGATIIMRIPADDIGS
jgi:signal transduction histidine kinase